MTTPAATYLMFVFIPSGMKRGKEAAHCGVSAGHFGKMVREGVLPQPRDASGVKLWLRQEVDDALFSLNRPETEGGESSCDAAFGL